MWRKLLVMSKMLQILVGLVCSWRSFVTQWPDLWWIQIWPFSFPEPLGPLSRRSLGTRKRRLWSHMSYLARFLDQDHSTLAFLPHSRTGWCLTSTVWWQHLTETLTDFNLQQKENLTENSLRKLLLNFLKVCGCFDRTVTDQLGTLLGGNQQ